jgi:6-phosphogluconolactonase
LVADLGLDRVFIYSLDNSQGQLTAGSQPFMKLASGAGPRHLTFHPNGRWVYIINESNMTMTAATWDDSTGSLIEINTAGTLPSEVTDRKGFSTAEVLVHPNGRFVYGSNRGHDSIVLMSIDAGSGRIDRVENRPSGGKTPRNFRLSRDGKWLLAENQNSGTIVSLSIDQATGKLNHTEHSVSIPSPACIRFLEDR